MNTLEILIKEYPGDHAWVHFCEHNTPDEPAECDQVALDPDIAQVLIAILGTVESVNDWIGKPLPALDGKNVSEVVNRPEGGRIIRSLIMRMP